MPLLRKTGRLATELPSLGKLPNDCSFRRHERGDGSHYGIAEDGSTTEYIADDVAILELNVRDLGCRVATALGLTPLPTLAGEIADAHLIATYVHRGLPCPIYLVLTSEADRFTAALATISAATTPALVLTPTVRRIERLVRNSISSKGVALVAMCDTFALVDGGILVCTRSPGQLLPDAATRACGESLQKDGVRSHTCIVVGGVEHRCDLTDREVAFLRAAWDRDEVPLDEMVHPKNGLISKRRFNNSRQHRNLVSRFLRTLNVKLQLDADPRVKLGFSLPARSLSVVRDQI